MVLGTFILPGGGIRASIPALVASSSSFSKLILLLLVAVAVLVLAGSCVHPQPRRPR